MKAFLVVGPECSGTRMLTDALIRAGAYGQASHEQEMDDLDFSSRPDLIVLRRSVPHGATWPDLPGIIRAMIASGYQVSPIVTFRDKDFCVKSQLRMAPDATDSEARARYYWAYRIIFEYLASCDIAPVICHYATFVNEPQYRAFLFRQLGLECPALKVFDADMQYPDVPLSVAGG